MFLETIFITETNNYTKRIGQSHTDHYPNTRAMNSHLHQFDPRKGQLYLLNKWQGRPKQLV